ncbi:hypothetical protein [uncultured Aggregatibacter sp.]|uniref:hypothetical protein n=1 Tax=uncultured Aggregatibacter sp. TaxID=470564 RepID=UPI001A554BBB|nr:hypothetical protein [uncultured Aggregatibacter sp.]VTX83738.1 Uncharacterised protein [uncultured Aggregatibacter sp.]
MAFWDTAWSAITGAFDSTADGAKSNGWATDALNWMDKNKAATNLLGNAVAGIGGYFAQKEAGRDLMKQQRELLNLQDQMKSKYSTVPDTDISYRSLTVDEAPGLANGGILTEMKKLTEAKGG